jgi:ubiquinone/menaquinone biosynthesis C-methylase UbiE
MAQRSQLIPWKSAGRLSERFASGDDVVRQTGWVFNNATGKTLTLAEFVASGDHEVPAYLDLFALRGADPSTRTLTEIGSGIGRMTCALTREFAMVVACDLDAGFLERCHEVVASFGRADRLRTVQVADGRTLQLADDSSDTTFSYITLQHCDADDVRSLVSEAIRITRPGGRLALNLRLRSPLDVVAMPVGSLVRSLFRIPLIGNWLSTRRSVTRFAWQANRVSPEEIIARHRHQLSDVAIWVHPDRESRVASIVAPVPVRSSVSVNTNHWWLVANVESS